MPWLWAVNNCCGVTFSKLCKAVCGSTRKRHNEGSQGKSVTDKRACNKTPQLWHYGTPYNNTIKEGEGGGGYAW